VGKDDPHVNTMKIMKILLLGENKKLSLSKKQIFKRVVLVNKFRKTLSRYSSTF